MARGNDEFDWIDDAFDDKRTAADIEKAKGAHGAGALFAAVLCACAVFMVFAVVSVLGAGL